MDKKDINNRSTMKVLYSLKTERVDYPLDTQITVSLQASGLTSAQAEEFRVFVLSKLDEYRGEVKPEAPAKVQKGSDLPDVF